MYKGNALANGLGNVAVLATDTTKSLFGGGDREVCLYSGFLPSVCRWVVCLKTDSSYRMIKALVSSFAPVVCL